MSLSNEFIVNIVDFITICLVDNVSVQKKNCIVLENEDSIIILESSSSNEQNKYDLHTTIYKDKMCYINTRNLRKYDKILVMDEQGNINDMED